MSTVDAALSMLELAFVHRLKDDEEFSSLTRLKYGWPKELLEKPTKAGLPVVTWFVPSRVRLGNTEPGHLEIQTDVWVWPDDQSGGREQLNAIDNCMMRLLGNETALTWEASWLDETTSFAIAASSVCIDAGDPPEKLLRRRRLWQVAPA